MKNEKMETKRTPFEQLPITDRFMFAMVFSHKEIAKPFLEAVLGIKIHELRDPEPEKTVETVEEPETKAKPKSANKAKTSTANKSRKAGSNK